MLKKIFLLPLLVALFASCKKDEKQVVYEGGTAPVLSTSATGPFVLQESQSARDAITFNWTNPDYRFNTGVSSQDVTYTLQFDTVGSNFTNPRMAEISIAKDLRKTLTVLQFNDAIAGVTKLALEPFVAHDIQVRLKSNLVNNTAILYSNPLEFTVTPFPDPNIPTLWITGDACPSSWTNTPPASQKFTWIRDKTFEINMDFVPGKIYKFLTKQGQWQPQWGGCGASGGTISENPGGGSDPDAIPTPAVAGTYKITVDLNAKTCTVVRI